MKETLELILSSNTNFFGTMVLLLISVGGLVNMRLFTIEHHTNYLYSSKNEAEKAASDEN